MSRGRWSSTPPAPPKSTPEVERLRSQILGLQALYQEILNQQKDRVLKAILVSQVAALDRVLTLFFPAPSPPLDETTAS